MLETALGGRIYERTPTGVEHEWGEVTVWEPPTRLGYRWHLRRAAAALSGGDRGGLVRGPQPEFASLTRDGQVWGPTIPSTAKGLMSRASCSWNQITS